MQELDRCVAKGDVEVEQIKITTHVHDKIQILCNEGYTSALLAPYELIQEQLARCYVQDSARDHVHRVTKICKQVKPALARAYSFRYRAR